MAPRVVGQNPVTKDPGGGILPGWVDMGIVPGSPGLRAFVGGAEHAPPMMLIHGLGQCVADWPTTLVSRLTTDFRVIAFDNRDAGCSDRFEQAGAPPLFRLWLGQLVGMRLAAPAYSLADMADDAFRVCDHFAIDQIHIVGVSMGGMIAQRMALAADNRIASLTLIMSSSGATDLPSPLAHIEKLMRNDTGQVTLDVALANAITLREALAVALTAVDRAELRERIARSLRYGWRSGDGVTRQFAAIFDDQSRAAALSAIGTPALVIHGTLDPLVPVAHGRDLAERLSARFENLPTMGHEITASLGQPIARLIADHAHATINNSKRS